MIFPGQTSFPPQPLADSHSSPPTCSWIVRLTRFCHQQAQSLRNQWGLLLVVCPQATYETLWDVFAVLVSSAHSPLRLRLFIDKLLWMWHWTGNPIVLLWPPDVGLFFPTRFSVIRKANWRTGRISNVMTTLYHGKEMFKDYSDWFLFNTPTH